MELFDKIDIDILQELNSNFKTNLISIGEKLGVSHSTVKYRIDNMHKKELISRSYNVNVNKLNMEFYLVLVSVNNKEKFKANIDHCSKMMSYYDSIGEYNMVLLMLVENMNVISAMFNYCEFYSTGDITKKTILPLLNYNRVFREINFSYREKDKGSCHSGNNNSCLACRAYKTGSCVGCPSKKGYKGELK